MTIVRTILVEIFGLFVDDGGFAVAILAWITVAWALKTWLNFSTAWGGLLLFAGLASILIGSALHRAAVEVEGVRPRPNT